MRSLCFLLCTSVLGVATSTAEEIDFDTDVVPLLSKAGCNAASCHGSAAGQAGFRLSLFGGDPGFDYRSIVNELEGRRVNYVTPRKSLLLTKPTGQLDHGGGDVLDVDSEAAEVISQWIDAGAPRKMLRQLERLIVTPSSFAASSIPAKLQIKVSAVFSDGLRRDVTETAVYVSQNESALDIDEAGAATLKLSGQHVANVRYGNQVTSISVTSPIGSVPPTLSDSARANWIDDQINAKLLALRISPAEPCNDRNFLRRVSLDLTGRLPSPALVKRLKSGSAPIDRAELIDELLGSDEFTDYWTHRLATQLRIQTPGTDRLAANAFYSWLHEQVAADVGWDSIADSLVLSQGDTRDPGAASVHRYFATAREEAEYMSEVLMGVRLRCANCHNHPLDRWTQDDYHGLAAVFVGLDRGQVVRYTGRGQITHPRTGEPALAKIPGQPFLLRDGDQRKSFADWLTSPDNPYFAKAMAGRVWEALMGRGLVSPVDDLRATNPPSHPELLNRLTECFVDHDYKLRPLIRLICNSAAYSRASGANDPDLVDDRFYSQALTKPLSAEVLADAISDVTGVADDYEGVRRAIHVVDRTVSASKLEFLGQCLPGESCSSGVSRERGIASQLHLMNGDLINAKIRDSDGRLHSLIDQGASTDEIVDTFYLVAFSRPPTHNELAAWVDRMDSAPDPQERTARLEDFLWALLNCHEFSSNN
ncbi:DUF1553 domain-containing protein [Roseimaritima ulvae]|uniref:Planctomycete cytochrome C n=1 Tax=Roseimaritima ulvae TaxID=980254 RepID=A0A5B9QSB0_9BACT|nr:DUF1553 domain-containing protein [Roseimaritima ulvae]QEG40799.1 hypothetical protein UC8_28170 [Roseimaritima ulvae]